MKYLVDANVLSEPTRAAPASSVVAWLRDHIRDLVLDPIIVAEIRAGILVLPEGRRRTALESWYADVVRTMECLPWDVEVAECWAQLLSDLRRQGKTLPRLDSMIAATALARDLIVVTRNVSDFQRAGVAVINPFDDENFPTFNVSPSARLITPDDVRRIEDEL